MENNKISGETDAEKTDSIFTEEDFSLEGYDKHIRQARNAIFVAAGILVIQVLIYAFGVGSEYEYLWIDLLIYGVFVGGFIFLGFWTKKKPYYAIIGALCLYGAFIALNAAIDIKTIFSGIILKIIIIVVLIKGLRDAKEAQERKTMLGK